MRLILAAKPPLKGDDYPIAPVADRLAMLHLAAADAATDPTTRETRFVVDDRELARNGPSYTIDTVRELTAAGEQVHWLIGADQLLALHRWHRFDELRQIAQFWVMARPGYAIDWAALPPAVAALQQHRIDVPQLDISATQIRERLRAGGSIAEWVTPSVEAYIRSHGLYL